VLAKSQLIHMCVCVCECQLCQVPINGLLCFNAEALQYLGTKMKRCAVCGVEACAVRCVETLSSEAVRMATHGVDCAAGGQRTQARAVPGGLSGVCTNNKLTVIPPQVLLINTPVLHSPRCIPLISRFLRLEGTQTPTAL
jgi:hypothetical protein